jgi:hypothetical protein
MELGVRDEFSEIKPPLWDHPIASDLLETVSGSIVVKPMVYGW